VNLCAIYTFYTSPHLCYHTTQLVDQMRFKFVVVSNYSGSVNFLLQ